MLLQLHPGQPFPDPYPEGAILLIDKPLGWSSFDVVNKVCYHLSRRVGVKRIKIGHAGTLDPLATGLLILCTGKYTKNIEVLQAEAKTYTGTFVFGATTDSYDLEKPPSAFFPTEHLTDQVVSAVVPRFLGDVEQIPPVYSAIKIDGKRVYKHARTGQEVDMPARTIKIYDFEVGPLSPIQLDPTRTEPRNLAGKGTPIWQHPDYAQGLQCDFRVQCSKGTYIRTLAADMGEAVGSGAYLSALRRTASGGFSVDHAWQVEALIEWCKP
jgi:tRNA pseudouridine55 synthase